MNLYIVATPIGNLQDITIRAASVLLSVPYIITESASKTSNLLDFFSRTLPNLPKTPNRPKIISYSESEEDNKLPSLLKILEENDAALVSEAGTPLISDPGFKLVREAIKRGIRIIPIPGASASITAVSASGLPTNNFTFLGYLPKSNKKKMDTLKKFKNLSPTLILFESPHRLVETLQAILEIFGDINIVIAREMTKVHEEFRREKVSESIKHFTKTVPRGEFVILL